MSWKIGMPNLGHTMEEGMVSEWLKKVGDPVARGETIATVESDKANFDVESPADGVLLAIVAEPGAVVAVGATIGVVGQEGEQVEGEQIEADAAADSPAPGEPARPSASDISAGARRPGRISPAARALAEQLGVDPDEVVASGEDGMVTRDDVRAHAAARASKAESGGGETVPLSPMRRAIAEATQRAWREIPRVALNGRANVETILESGAPLTAAIGRASALALKEHASFNGWLLEEGFRRAGQVDLAFAVSTGNGLVTAVVREAERKAVSGIAAELRDYADAARQGSLAGDRMVGGSFTVSSLGRWGVESFDPIIAPPQVAILGVGRIDRVAREKPDGGVRFASEVILTLVFDHRANDGVEAAKLLQSIVGFLENPERMEVRS